MFPPHSHDSIFRSILAVAKATAISGSQTACQTIRQKMHNTASVNKIILIMWCNQMQFHANTSWTEQTRLCDIRLFLLIPRVRCRAVRDGPHSPWLYQFIIHSLYSASVGAQGDIHPWMHFVPGAFAKSTRNWISIDLHWHSLGLHVLGRSDAHQPAN